MQYRFTTTSSRRSAREFNGEEVLFAEYWGSGISRLHGWLALPANGLTIAVTKEALWVKFDMLIQQITNFYDLNHRIPWSAVKRVCRSGFIFKTRFEISFTTAEQNDRTIVLYLWSPVRFVESLVECGVVVE